MVGWRNLKCIKKAAGSSLHPSEAAAITDAAQSCAGLKGSSLSRVLPTCTCTEVHALMLFVVRKKTKKTNQHSGRSCTMEAWMDAASSDGKVGGTGDGDGVCL